MGVVGQRHAPAAFTPVKDLVAIVQEAGWAPGPVRIDAETLGPTGIRSPDRPARSSVAIPTTLYRPSTELGCVFIALHGVILLST
jgi:hypothetical protein